MSMVQISREQHLCHGYEKEVNINWHSLPYNIRTVLSTQTQIFTVTALFSEAQQGNTLTQKLLMFYEFPV